MPKLIRITTVPISLKHLITGQMRYMKENGFEVIMMSADGPEVDYVIEKEDCDHIVIPLTRKITPIKDLQALWILFKKLKRIKPEIVHSHTPKAGIIGMLAAWLARVPIRIHTVAGLPLQTAAGAKRKLLEVIEQITYFYATEVWPNSKSLYDFIIENKFSKVSKLHIIGKGSSNGIDISEFNSQTLDEKVLFDIREKIDYDASNIYLLFVGRVVKDKGIVELVEAFSLLKPTFKNLKLLIVGPLENELDPLPGATLQAINVDADIITVGYSNYVKYYMLLADLFVFPSHREGFPNVPMQAALMECPIVASRITGNIDIIDPNVNGYLHEIKNTIDLKDKISQALSRNEQTMQFATKLKEKVTQNFDRKEVQNVILEKYNQLLSHVK